LFAQQKRFLESTFGEVFFFSNDPDGEKYNPDLTFEKIPFSVKEGHYVVHHEWESTSTVSR
jgi:hypothetical protein